MLINKRIGNYRYQISIWHEILAYPQLAYPASHIFVLFDFLLVKDTDWYRGPKIKHACNCTGNEVDLARALKKKKRRSG